MGAAEEEQMHVPCHHVHNTPALQTGQRGLQSRSHAQRAHRLPLSVVPPDTEKAEKDMAPHTQISLLLSFTGQGCNL